MSHTNTPVPHNGSSLEQAHPETRYPMPYFSMFNNPFFSFQYTKQVVSFSGDHTTVQGEHHEFQNGQLTSERFSGTLPGNPFSETLEMFQKQMLDSLEMFLKGMNLISPR